METNNHQQTFDNPPQTTVNDAFANQASTNTTNADRVANKDEQEDIVAALAASLQEQNVQEDAKESKLTEKSFTIIESTEQKDKLSSQEIDALLKQVAVDLLKNGKLSNEQMVQVDKLDFEDMSYLLEHIKHQKEHGYYSTMEVISGMVEFCKLAYKLSGQGNISEESINVLIGIFNKTSDLNCLDQFLDMLKANINEGDNLSSSNNNEATASNVQEKKKLIESSSDTSSQQINDLGLQNLLNEALENGDQAQVDQILALMGDGC